jgi:hypothetical protein
VKGSGTLEFMQVVYGMLHLLATQVGKGKRGQSVNLVNRFDAGDGEIGYSIPTQSQLVVTRGTCAPITIAETHRLTFILSS